MWLSRSTPSRTHALRHARGPTSWQVPVVWRAVVEMGCVCTVSRRPGGRADEYNISDLNFKTTAECDYLPDGSFQSAYLHHSQTGTRGIYLVVIPAQRAATVVVVDPGRNAGLPPMARAWSEVQTWAQENLPASQAPASALEFTTRVVANVRAATRVVQQTLVKLASEKRTPTMLVVQSPLRTSVLSSQITALTEFPVVRMPENARDSTYPALDWQRYGARRLLRQHAAAAQWLAATVATARYAHVPIGNLPSDAPPYICDVFLARALRVRQSSWAGGGESDVA